MSLLCALAARRAGYTWVYQVIQLYGIVIDDITLYILLFNWTAVGVCAVFWQPSCPPKVGQFYLIFISAMMAWALAWLPSWTGWAILVGLAIYDIFAVLCPGGPLRLLVEEAQRRDDAIPALVYNTTMPAEDRSSSDSSGDRDATLMQQRQQHQQRQQQQQQRQQQQRQRQQQQPR